MGFAPALLGAAACAAILATACARAPPRLVTTANGTFKIAMFADMHYGEGEAEAWGPAQDANSTRVQNAVLQSELNGLGLVVMLGDMITGNNVHSNSSAYWDEFTLPVRANFSGLPWATILGNHDDYPFQADGSPRPYTVETQADRRELLANDLRFADSATQLGPAGISLASNYFLPVGSHGDPQGPPELLLYFLDSGGGRAPEVVYPDQVAWLEGLRTQHIAKWGKGVRSLLFMHIPCPQYTKALHSPQGFFGMALDNVTPTANDTGVFAVAKDTGIQAVFVGHDHGNDFCGSVEGVWLCFGRHSGYGGYGSWRRGSRVVELGSDGAIRTWVRMEDGDVVSSGELVGARDAQG